MALYISSGVKAGRQLPYNLNTYPFHVLCASLYTYIFTFERFYTYIYLYAFTYNKYIRYVLPSYTPKEKLLELK